MCRGGRAEKGAGRHAALTDENRRSAENEYKRGDEEQHEPEGNRRMADVGDCLAAERAAANINDRMHHHRRTALVIEIPRGRDHLAVV